MAETLPRSGASQKLFRLSHLFNSQYHYRNTKEMWDKWSSEDWYEALSYLPNQEGLPHLRSRKGGTTSIFRTYRIEPNQQVGWDPVPPSRKSNVA